MSHMPHFCPSCGSGMTTAGLCDACMRLAETQPEQVFPSAPEQNNVQGQPDVLAPGTPVFPPGGKTIIEGNACAEVSGRFARFIEESGPVDPEAFKKLTCGEWDLKQDCKECGTRLTSQNRVDIKEFEDLCYTCYKKKPKHVCVDLDGVLAQYDGWKGPNYIGPPRDGAREFLKALVEAGYQVILHTTRRSLIASEWLRQYDMKHLVSLVTSEKRPALAYLDDRSIPFEGDFGDALEAIKGFLPYWRRPKVDAPVEVPVTLFTEAEALALLEDILSTLESNWPGEYPQDRFEYLVFKGWDLDPEAVQTIYRLQDAGVKLVNHVCRNKCDKETIHD